MTSLVAWIGVDTHGVASVYFAGDSRIIKTDAEQRIAWDFGRKVFAARRSPDILAYNGDALLASHTLSQIIDLIDTGAIFKPNSTPNERAICIIEHLYATVQKYPDGFGSGAVEVLYGTREGDKMASNFFIYSIRVTGPRLGVIKDIEITPKSSIIYSTGTGKHAIDSAYERYKNSKYSNTSRCAFRAFCDSIHPETIKGKSFGGSPQLVGLYRIGNAQSFGVIFERGKYYNGLQANNLGNPEMIDWRNEDFTECHPITGVPLESKEELSKHKKKRDRIVLTK